mmetsp:Transcript_18724/g.40259  ORF Transcript_18724/g.40259 Transcript_18724/m.40259 type:complete len:178 (-) Transcript_18724:458-991(-)
MRAELASSMSLAETLDKFKQLEDEVQAVRDQLKADSEELEAWEQRTADARNNLLFFKTLYAREKKKGGASGASSSSGSSSSSSSSADPGYNKEAVKKLAATIKAPAQAEVHSPARLYLFTYLASILGFVVVQDFMTGEPSLGLDGLYTVLGVLLAFNAWNERGALTAPQEGTGDKEK